MVKLTTVAIPANQDKKIGRKIINKQLNKQNLQTSK